MTWERGELTAGQFIDESEQFGAAGLLVAEGEGVAGV